MPDYEPKLSSLGRLHGRVVVVDSSRALRCPIPFLGKMRRNKNPGAWPGCLRIEQRTLSPLCVVALVPDRRGQDRVARVSRVQAALMPAKA